MRCASSNAIWSATTVTTVVDAGYSGLKNGVLLRAAEGDFDVLITVDRNLPFQQNLGAQQIAVLIIIAEGVTYPDLKPLVPEVLAALRTIKPGELLQVEKKLKT